MEEAFEFIKSQNEKVQDKIFYNIRKAQLLNDPKLFKKLNHNIWELRTIYAGLQYRILAFWDKENNKMTLVCGTHGLVKKTDKVSTKEIEKAEKSELIILTRKRKKNENIQFRRSTGFNNWQGGDSSQRPI
nr:type II toxin-antitoxin system RelE/ParE family toxin [Cyclobacterium marinum]